MALSIKSEEADRLARELAEVTGESLTESVVVALRQRLDRVRRASSIGIEERLSRLADDVARLPVVDDRPAEEIIGYDERGLPA